MAAAVSGGVVLAINYAAFAGGGTPERRLLALWISTWPWIPWVFTSFVGAELACDGGLIDRTELLRTFLGGGSISVMNILMIIGMVEGLFVLRRRWSKGEGTWKMIGDNYKATWALCLIGALTFWVWHLFAVYWFTQYLLPTLTGVYIAINAASMMAAMVIGFSGAYRCVIVDWPVPKDKGTAMAHVRAWVSAVLVAGVVAGVVLLGATTHEALVGSIGELPIISTISIAWVYFNSDGKNLEEVRNWTHAIQLFFKCGPLFIVLTCVSLLPVPCHPGDDWWTRFGWCVLAGFINFVTVVLIYGIGAFFFAREQMRNGAAEEKAAKEKALSYVLLPQEESPQREGVHRRTAPAAESQPLLF